MLLPGEVVQIPSLAQWKEYCSMQENFQQLAEFFLYLKRELKLIVLVIKGYRSACNNVFILSGMDIASELSAGC